MRRPVRNPAPGRMPRLETTVSRDETQTSLREEQLARRRLNRLMDALPVFSGFCSPDGHLLQTRPPTAETFLWALPAFAYSHDSITQIVDLCERAARGEAVQVERPYHRATADAPNALPDASALSRGLLTLSPLLDAEGFVEELAITLMDCDDNGLSVRDARAKGRMAQTNERIDGVLSLAQTVIEALATRAERPRPARSGAQGGAAEDELSRTERSRQDMTMRLDVLALIIDAMADPYIRDLPLSRIVELGLSTVPDELRAGHLRLNPLDPSDAPIPMAFVPIFTLVISELAANARAHGAWRDDARGLVTVECEVLDSAAGRRIRLHWIEDGGPSVSAVLSRGFGLSVTERLFPQITGGSAHLLDNADGLSWTLELPVGVTAQPDNGPDEDDGAFGGGFDGGFTG